MIDIDPVALEALAGLRPMPRTPLTINPCPRGYTLQNLGGQLMCVLEGAEALTPEEANALELQAGSGSASHFRPPLQGPPRGRFTQSYGM